MRMKWKQKKKTIDGPSLRGLDSIVDVVVQ